MKNLSIHFLNDRK